MMADKFWFPVCITAAVLLVPFCMTYEAFRGTYRLSGIVCGSIDVTLAKAIGTLKD